LLNVMNSISGKQAEYPDTTTTSSSNSNSSSSNSNSNSNNSIKKKEISDEEKKDKNVLVAMSLVVLSGIAYLLLKYAFHSTYVASIAYSSPSIVIDAGVNPQTGQRIMWDDYREAYFWLRQNTHEESKILSWWDYGYQMSAMANRTVLVDNNTWNNTHIATVGRALASTEEDAYPIFESLDVDYVLVIFGGLTGYSSDDVNKFLWPVRIGSGVFPNDMPSERDFYSSQGQFDIGPNGSPQLHNCVAYKLCYYRFGQMQTRYGKPPGFDLARQQEVGVKNIQLSTMEEAFTSEHWIVRIYKVNKRPTLESSSTQPFASTKTPSPEDDNSNNNDDDTPETAYVGCFTSESYFVDKSYDGGSTGANFNLALHYAMSSNKKYFAIARSDSDGHSFAFSRLGGAYPRGNTRQGGCERACLDDQTKQCGCSDYSCTSALPSGEEHNRRWAVYEIL